MNNNYENVIKAIINSDKLTSDEKAAAISEYTGLLDGNVKTEYEEENEEDDDLSDYNPFEAKKAQNEIMYSLVMSLVNENLSNSLRKNKEA